MMMMMMMAPGEKFALHDNDYNDDKDDNAKDAAAKDSDEVDEDMMMMMLMAPGEKFEWTQFREGNGLHLNREYLVETHFLHTLPYSLHSQLHSTHRFHDRVEKNRIVY